MNRTCPPLSDVDRRFLRRMFSLSDRLTDSLWLAAYEVEARELKMLPAGIAEEAAELKARALRWGLIVEDPGGRAWRLAEGG